MPFAMINDWLLKEKNAGSTAPNRAVLATATDAGTPHSRIVAIREIAQDNILFFTQKGTRKEKELRENPKASMTIWLAMQQKEIILDGYTKALSDDENKYYWESWPHDRQLRFTAYAPTSGKPISSKSKLDDALQRLSEEYKNSSVPMSPYYCGFRMIPEIIYFYSLGSVEFCDVVKYINKNQTWASELLSP